MLNADGQETTLSHTPNAGQEKKQGVGDGDFLLELHLQELAETTALSFAANPRCFILLMVSDV